MAIVGARNPKQSVAWRNAIREALEDIESAVNRICSFLKSEEILLDYSI